MGWRSDGWASSPEELELLLEDAVLLGDGSTVAALFASGAVLVDGPRVVGPERAMAAFTHLGYLAATRTVTHYRDLAATLGHQAANVSVRAPDGAWRLVATVLRARTAYDEI